MPTVSYNQSDLELFSKASHDASRLHMSEEYARQTIYGEAIVFGVLGVFASLGALRARRGLQLATATIVYRIPLYMGVDYQIETKEPVQDRASVAIKNADSTLLSCLFGFREQTEAADEREVPGTAPLREQAAWTPEELRRDVVVAGRYAPSPEHLRMLIERWRLADRGVTRAQVAVLLWSSYLTGMQLPGLLGTSAQLRLAFRPDGPAPVIPFDYVAELAEFDERFSLLRTKALLSGPRGVFADAEVSSHLRAGPGQPDP
jgi:hypothetical protein